MLNVSESIKQRIHEEWILIFIGLNKYKLNFFNLMCLNINFFSSFQIQKHSSIIAAFRKKHPPPEWLAYEYPSYAHHCIALRFYEKNFRLKFR
jgi:hypothetical protein